MMKYLLAITIVLTLFFSSSFVSVAYAQYFKFQPANGATPAAQIGNTFDMKVLINTTGKQSLGGDAIIVFDPAVLSVKGAVTGKFYDQFQDHAIGGTTNKYLLSAWQQSELTPTSTSTDALYATVTFNALTAGNTTLSFDCTSGNADSNIWDTTPADIIKCSDTKSLAVNIGAPGPTSTPAATLTPGPTATPAATATPQPTSTPVPTNTPKPSIAELPRTGTTEVTFAAVGLGLVLTVVGILVIL